MKLIKDYTLEELKKLLLKQNEKSYRAVQIFEWLWQKEAGSFDDMSNLSIPMRNNLKKNFRIDAFRKKHIFRSSDNTKKYLFCLDDGENIESVFIPSRKRNTVCVSTQVGCKFGCRFCASGLEGYRRNLSPGEIIDQVLYIKKTEGKVDNVVYMGMGEPLDNYDNVIKSLHILNSNRGMNIGARRITISTSGLVPMINRLSEVGLQVELSISLHAATDDVRNILMPINKKYPIKTLIDACRSYSEKTGRLITFEYTLLRGINDMPSNADKLGKILNQFPLKINIIPWNKVDGLKYEQPSADATNRFYERLKNNGIRATLRKTRGRDISAACGQLSIVANNIRST